MHYVRLLRQIHAHLEAILKGQRAVDKAAPFAAQISQQLLVAFGAADGVVREYYSAVVEMRLHQL